MEPIAELEDDEEGSYDYDSPSGGMDSLSDSRNMMQFRSRSNTWPQFSSVPYDELASEAIDDDTQELKDKGDLCVAPYSLYDDPYRGLDGEPAGSLYSGNHLGQAATGGDFVSQHGEHTSTSTSTNLSSLHKSSPSGGSAFYSTAPSGAAGLTRASNHFSSRSDELDASPSAEHPAGLNGSHTHLHEAAAGTGAASSATGQSGSAAAAAAVAAASALKKNTSRRNAWGNMSYADLITQAINGSPEKRLTLSQIYEWMVQNVTYFKDKGDSNSSAGWKNSIRHNLSLHNRFMRVQNEGTGKSSWWMINPDAKPGKAARRRAISMETHNYEKRRGRVKRRVEQLRAAGMGCDPSALTPLSEYPLKSSEPSLLMSSSSGSSSYKLAGSTSSLLSPQTSLSNLCLADSSGGPSGANSAILVASPSSTDSYDPFSESSINVVNHFHSTGGNYSPGEFRPRASSNASSTCSTVNHLVDTDSHQVASLSPHHWNSADMCLYGSTGNSYGSGLDQAGLSSNFRAAAGADPLQLQLIDGLANLGTGSPSAHNAFRMMKEEAELMHKNGASVPTCVGSTEGSAGSGTHSEMMLLGADLTSGHGASGHSYNDLYKLQSTPQTAPISPSTSSPPLSANSSKPCFTSLDTAPAKAVSCGAAAASYFKSPSLEAAGKVHEINNNAAGGTATGALLYEYHRYAEQQRSASLANLAAYQHDQQQHPGKMLGFMYSQEAAQMGCYGAVYGGGEAQFSYYDYPEVSHGLNSLTYNSHSGGDLDLDFDTVCPQSGMLECDVDQPKHVYDAYY